MGEWEGGNAPPDRAGELGRQLRKARQSQGLTQRALAQASGTTQAMVARMEGGRVSPSLNTLGRIAGALGTELIVDLRSPELAGSQPESVSDPESLLTTLDALAPTFVWRPPNDEVVRRLTPCLPSLLEMNFAGHPWAELLVASLAYNYGRNRPLALGMVRHSREIFRRARDRAGQSCAAFALGIFELARGDLVEATRRWQQARELLPEDSLSEPIDELALTHSALEYYMRGDLDGCAATARQAVVLSQLRASGIAEGLALTYLAFVGLNRGDFAETESLLGRAAAALGEIPEAAGPRALVDTCLGSLFALRGEVVVASEHFSRAEACPEEWFSVIGSAARAELLAEAQPDHGERAAQQVLAFSDATGDRWWRTWAQRGLGTITRIRGELKESRQILMEIEDLNPLERSRTLLSIGDTELASGDLPAARRAYEEAAERFEAAGATYWLVRALAGSCSVPGASAPSLTRARDIAGHDAAYRLVLARSTRTLHVRWESPRAILVDGVAVTFRSQGAADLIYTLAEHGARSRTDLSRALWPDVTRQTAAARLRTALWEARRMLGTESWRLRQVGPALELLLTPTDSEPSRG